jgi:tripeptidyl-peptidase-2
MERFNFKAGLMALLFFCLTLWTPAAHAFNDVQEGHWAKRDIDLLVARDIVSGYSDGTYRPGKGVTRAEFTVLLIKALNLEDTAATLKAAGQLFRDVNEGYWAKGYIHLAWELGVVGGYSDGTFRPDNTIRRDEMVAMLVRALRNGGQGNRNVTFTDESKIPQWAKNAVLLAAKWGLVSGFEDGSFRAAATVTRAQAATFINNFLLQRGAQFDLYGQIVGLNKANRQLKVAYNGEEITFAYLRDCKVYQDGKAVSLETLDRDSFYGLLVLDDQGRVSYMEVANSPLTGGTSLSLGTKIQPVEGSRSNKGKQAGLLERELDTAITSIKTTLERAKNSFEITKQELGASRLSRDLGVDGTGQVIAIIDSGIDPGHPDLLKTPAGEDKLVDFIDLTTEGLVNTERTVSAKNMLTLDGVSYILGNITSKSNVYHYGFLEEEKLGMDLNFNGELQDRFLVLVTDGQVSGQYDTVFIDTNNNASLLDEEPLTLFREGKKRQSLKSAFAHQSFNFVLSDLDSKGNFLKLGFDINGHGTQVAGVAAASGEIKGIAPGAKLLVIKVLDKRGETSWEQLEKAVKLAAEKGATVVNLSLGYYYDETYGNNSLTYLIEALSKKNGIVFVASAGNKGPGIGTLATPGNAKSAIGVGAYISKEMWKSIYDLDVKQDSLWYFSSAGPRQDGLIAPTVVAPGSAITSFPLWSGSTYRLAEGTSIASPHLAGAVALLLEGAQKQGISPEPELVKKAVILGAESISHFSHAEAGYGEANIYEAWRLLRRLEPQPPLKSYTWNRRLGNGEGIFAREFLPGLVPYRIQNVSSEDQTLFWKATEDWLEPWFEMTYLPKGTYRDVPLSYALPSKPGLYTGILEGRFLNSYGPEVSMMTTVIKPYILTAENGYRMEVGNVLGPAQLERYFFRVPEGTGSLQSLLTVPKDSGNYRGRVRMHLIKPNGEEYMMSDFAGLAKENTASKEWVGSVIENPDPGTWEVVVYSSPAIASLNLDNSQYRLRIQLAGVPETEENKVTARYLIGNVPKKLEPGKINYISLSVRDKQRKGPIEDIMIEINGQVYQVKNGWVTFSVIPESEQLKLDVRL